mmetsp:Transcript_91357/g.190997  ORF Transcript_91357/g.190997 Transcript_91357/m.190997 type:complete len:210 (+) Transcript_91357:1000-1629(+)
MAHCATSDLSLVYRNLSLRAATSQIGQGTECLSCPKWPREKTSQGLYGTSLGSSCSSFRISLHHVHQGTCCILLGEVRPIFDQGNHRLYGAMLHHELCVLRAIACKVQQGSSCLRAHLWLEAGFQELTEPGDGVCCRDAASSFRGHREMHKSTSCILLCDVGRNLQQLAKFLSRTEPRKGLAILGMTHRQIPNRVGSFLSWTDVAGIGG